MKNKVLNILKYTAATLGGLLIVVFFVRLPAVLNQRKTDAAVIKIHNTKLILDDVLGKNLPPDPGADADKTLAGIDANNNGIRDDVELAIFKQYPNSGKTRAVLLQYAIALQLETIDPLNEITATAIAEEDSRAYACIGEIVPRSNSDLKEIDAYQKIVEALQLNTQPRKDQKTKFEEDVRSFELKSGCDIDLKSLN